MLCCSMPVVYKFKAHLEEVRGMRIKYSEGIHSPIFFLQDSTHTLFTHRIASHLNPEKLKSIIII